MYVDDPTGRTSEKRGDGTHAAPTRCEGLMLKTLNENATYEPSKSLAIVRFRLRQHFLVAVVANFATVRF